MGRRKVKNGEGHLCVEEFGSYRCECLPGFEVGKKKSEDGAESQTCVDVLECSGALGFPNPCDRNGYSGISGKEILDVGTCIEKVGSYDCKCAPGFARQVIVPRFGGSAIINCENIDECFENIGTDDEKQLHLCKDPNSLCVDEIGSYRCECKPGFAEQNVVDALYYGEGCVDEKLIEELLREQGSANATVIAENYRPSGNETAQQPPTTPVEESGTVTSTDTVISTSASISTAIQDTTETTPTEDAAITTTRIRTLESTIELAPSNEMLILLCVLSVLGDEESGESVLSRFSSDGMDVEGLLRSMIESTTYTEGKNEKKSERYMSIDGLSEEIAIPKTVLVGLRAKAFTLRKNLVVACRNLLRISLC